MVKKICLYMVICLLYAFSVHAQQINEQCNTSEYGVNLYDAERGRLVPVAIYAPAVLNANEVVIFNHGYGANKGTDYLFYSHITRTLAQNGYFVVSIQHELPGDKLLAMEGDLYKNRLPNWERGVQNILFALYELKKKLSLPQLG